MGELRREPTTEAGISARNLHEMMQKAGDAIEPAGYETANGEHETEVISDEEGGSVDG